MPFESKFNIEQVVDLIGLQRVRNGSNASGHFSVVCPYCGDARGKMDVCVSRYSGGKLRENIFHCYNCGQHGTMLDLWVDTMGGSKTHEGLSDAYKDICDRLGLASTDYHKIAAAKPKTKHTKKASVQEMDRTYRTMLGFLELRKNDLEDLRRRALTDNEIASGMFRSTPTDPKGLCRRLESEGCTLEGVPGFYRDQKNEWMISIYAGNKGYFCPAFCDGMIVGMQIRIEEPKDGQKYKWLSSSGKTCGTSSGAPVSSYGDIHSESVILTEGILKSYVIHCITHLPVIGVPGVETLNELDPVLKRHTHKKIYECYDMDKLMSIFCDRSYDSEKCTKCLSEHGCYMCQKQFSDPSIIYCGKKIEKQRNISEAAAKLTQKLNNAGYVVIPMTWDTDRNGIWAGHFKGYDDYLAERRKNGWKR